MQIPGNPAEILIQQVPGRAQESAFHKLPGRVYRRSSVDHTLRKPALKEWGKKPFVALMECWFIFLECPQRDFGQLTNDSFFSHFTQTYIHTTSNKLDMNAGRGRGARLTLAGLSLCSPGQRWVLSQECAGARSRPLPARCSQVSQGP